MARLGTVLGNHKISIESMIQKPVADGTHAEIIIVTHRTSERHLQAAVKELDQEGLTKLPPVILRVEEV
jgi:homoserine dehydrogenase